MGARHLRPGGAAGRAAAGFLDHDAAQGKHWIERWAARCPPDLVFSNRHYTAKTLPNLFGGPAAPACEIIHCPVSPPVAPPAPAVRAAFAPASTRRRTPASSKGHALHLDAVSRLANVSGWICWIFGGAQRSPVQAYLAKLREQATHAGINDRMRSAFSA